MIEILNGYYYKWDGMQYVLIHKYECECVDKQTRKKTGEVRTAYEYVGYYTTIASMLTALVPRIVNEGIDSGEIKTIEQHIEQLRAMKEELEGSVLPF